MTSGTDRPGRPDQLDPPDRPGLPPPRRHADDHSGPRVRHCPFCGRVLDAAAFVQEYWSGTGTRTFHLWCPSCAVIADVAVDDHVVTHEPAH